MTKDIKDLRERFYKFAHEMSLTSAEEMDVVVDWFEAEFNKILEGKIQKLQGMKPILYHKDSHRHIENVAIYNTLDEAINILGDNIETNG